MILSTAYLGNIQYFTKLATDRAAIEACENFQKQSYRNRADIATAGGVRALTVPIVWNHHEKMPIRDVRIDYTLPWQRSHWRTIRAAYAAAPYFDHYAEKLVEFYETKRYEFLFDLNTELTAKLLELLKIPVSLELTTDYTPASALAEGEDFRDSISPKARLQRHDEEFTPPRYFQMFEDRLPFAPNLSVVDLLFCEGQML